MASSSSSVNIQAKYDVFLSFRGEDTRHNFTSHLYSALIKKDVAAFIDDDGLERGDEISPALLKAIEDSVISVIIFSKDYAASRWCLDELARIIECKNTNGQIVVPVFYHIEPTDVRKQTRSFEKAFVEHEERFKETPERVQIWRAALTQAADLSGYHVMKNRPEAKSVDEIVEDLLRKLSDKSSLTGDCEDLVGINSRIEQVRTLFSKSQVIGIWGMGGIGKTTIAKTLFNQISRDFDGCCFIENVREELEKSGGGLLQQRIISKLLGENSHVFDTPNSIPQFTKNRLQRKKVLIALDDVNDSENLEGLIQGLKPLSHESKIIITTRDKQVLLSNEVNDIYEVGELNKDESLLLFCKRAFKQNYPFNDLQQLSYMMIKYVGGNPLVIRVVGSALYGKSKEEWDSVKDNLNEIGGTKISKMLNIGFDALEDTEKKIFLDIACFFKGENEDLAKLVLKACYPSSPYFLGNLINKSLIKISNGKLQMHDLLQEMGWRIVCQESKNNPGERTRLWHYNDIYDVLQNNKGTEAVESILLDMSRINEMHLSSNAFENMTNLRLLKLFHWRYVHCEYQPNINKVCLPQGLEYLSNKLIYLRWDGYPLKALPSKFSVEKLVALELPHSNIECPLEETKHDSSLLGCLRDTLLEGCNRLLKVPSPIQYFRNLHILNMRGCPYLKRFPRNIHFESSITIDLSCCINLTKFPQISGNVKILLLSETAIEEVPATIASLSELEYLVMYNCGKLRRISTSIWKLRTLGVLNLGWCFEFETLPEKTEEMEKLKRRSLSKTAIKELRPSIENLTAQGCPISVDNYLYLRWFRESGFAISHGPYTFALGKKFSGFEWLDLSGCNLTEFPEVICSLSSLKYLSLDGNYFKSIPKSIKQLSKLRELFLEYCYLLQSIPELPLKLDRLSLYNCKQLRSLPELPSNEEQFDNKDDSIWCRGKYFSFVNCLNLKENVSLQRVQHMATVLQHSYGKVTGFYFTLPGSEIPNWFNNRNFGSSIIIELPQQYCCNRRLIGFALSVVVPPHNSCSNHSYRHSVGVICEPYYALDYKIPRVGVYVSSIQSDHIIICLCPCTNVRLFEGQCTTITFKFFCCYRDSPTNFKCCGVRPIYEESNMALSDTCIERFSSTHEDLKEAILVDCSNTSGSGDSRSSDEKLEPQPYIDCTGNLQVWRVNGQEKILLSAADQSKLYSGDCFIFQYSYPGEENEECLIGTWFGKQSMEDDRASSTSMASKMVESMKFQVTQARIYEGSEPIQFFAIFQSLIVFKGGLSDGYKKFVAEKEIPDETYNEDGVALFRVQGSGPDNMQSMQVEAVASSLNSSYCYILHNGSTVFTWSGSVTTSENQELVERQLDLIKPNLQTKPQKEGAESDQFWELLGGKSEYPSQKLAREGESDSHLFSCTFSKGNLKVTEIYNFTQDDLMTEDIFILDSHSEIFVWVGQQVDAKSKMHALTIGEKFLEHDFLLEKLSPEAPIYIIMEGNEPPFFTRFFTWDSAKSSMHGNSFQRKLTIVKNGGTPLVDKPKRRTPVSYGGRSSSVPDKSQRSRSVSFSPDRVRVRGRSPAFNALAANFENPNARNLSTPPIVRKIYPKSVTPDSVKLASKSNAIASLSSSFEKTPTREKIIPKSIKVSPETVNSKPKPETKESDKNMSSRIESLTIQEDVKESEAEDEEGLPIYPYERLKITSTDPVTEIDVTKRETYLSSEEFREKFGMTKDAFYKLAKWKQNKRKMSLQLF